MEKTTLGRREIFMRNGQYIRCDVIEDQQQDREFSKRTMVCRTPDGREFVAKPMYGTWGEIRPDMTE